MAAVVVENGNGLANADGYISEANADVFLSSRGDAIFHALSLTVQGNLLRQATDFMVQTYRYRWRGARVSITQALDWPRNFVILEDFGNNQSQYGYGYPGAVVDSNIVPTEIQRACAMLALIANDGALAPILSRVVRSRKVDVIETVYEPSAPPYKVYRAVAMTLSPYLSPLSSGTIVQLVRS